MTTRRCCVLTGQPRFTSQRLPQKSLYWSADIWSGYYCLAHMSPTHAHAHTHNQKCTHTRQLKHTHAHPHKTTHIQEDTHSIVAAICWALIPRFAYHDSVHTNKLVQTNLSVCLISFYQLPMATKTGHCIIREALLAVLLWWKWKLNSQCVWSSKHGERTDTYTGEASFGTEDKNFFIMSDDCWKNNLANELMTFEKMQLFSRTENWSSGRISSSKFHSVKFQTH